MSRALVALVALGLMVDAAAPAPAPAAGQAVVICTADGPRTVRLDDAGRPLTPEPSDQPVGCAHLWCEPRRQRLAGRRRS